MFKGEFFFLILDHLVLILHFAARLVEHQFHRKHKYKSRCLQPGGMMLLFLSIFVIDYFFILFAVIFVTSAKDAQTTTLKR